MSFKKKRLEKTNFIINFVWAIVIFFMLYLWAYSISIINDLNLWNKKVVKTTNSSWEIIEETVVKKKQLNILLVWRWWYWNDAPQLTDSIILAKVNSEKKTVSLLSIQRDLYVAYPNSEWHWKINSIYSHYYYQSLNQNNFYKISDEEEKKNLIKEAEREGITKLSEKIQDITWESVDFYINVDFNGFIWIIDAIWWVEIDVKEDLVDHSYPTANWWTQTIRFRKWLQLMNWDLALKYARSRKSTSDFDRSLRQQQIIEAVKNKFKNISIKDAIELYAVFTKYLTTDFSVEDIRWIFTNYKILQEEYTFVSSNFNDTCFSSTSECEKWWIVYTPRRDLFNNQWVSLINWTTPTSLSQYSVSKKYSNIVLNYPLIEKENFKINIFNAAWGSWIAWAFVNDLRKYGFNITKSNIFNAPERTDKSVIYYNWISDSDTLNALKEFFKGEIIQITEPKYPMVWKNLTTEEPKAQIEIIIWRDYLNDKNIFSF